VEEAKVVTDLKVMEEIKGEEGLDTGITVILKVDPGLKGIVLKTLDLLQ